MANKRIERPVVQAFRCKLSEKHFAIGDAYLSDDPERITFLEENGFLGPEVKPVEQSEDANDDLLAQSADKIIKALAAEEKEAAALQAIMDREASGKNRKSVVETLQDMLAKLDTPPTGE